MNRAMNTAMHTPPSAALPATVAWLGYGGLLPFIFLASATLLDPDHAPLFGDALTAYGAVILSFIGALHWGFAMTLPVAEAGAELAEVTKFTEFTPQQRNASFVWSVMPALIAWPALLLAPFMASLLLITGFLAHYWQDRRLARCVSLPAWYLPLRLRLTAVGCLCLACGGLAEFW